MVKTVVAPPELHSMIEGIESQYEKIFKEDLSFNPNNSRIHLAGHDVMFISLSTIGLTLKDKLNEVLGENGRDLFMYRVGKALGQSEAKKMIPKLTLNSVVEKIAAGPIWAAYSGFVRVSLLPGSNIVDNDDYFLIYEHPNNFEAEEWRADGRKASENICFFNAGYAAGWCSEATGIDIDSEEISCEAAGAPACRFIMFPASRRMEYMERIDEFKNI